MKGHAYAYVASCWRRYSSETKTTEQLVESLSEKGYLVEPGKVKPTRRPTRRDILRAAGREEEVETNG